MGCSWFGLCDNSRLWFVHNNRWTLVPNQIVWQSLICFRCEELSVWSIGYSSDTNLSSNFVAIDYLILVPWSNVVLESSGVLTS